MRIRYHFLADLHVIRQARETESEKRIRIIVYIPLGIHRWIFPGKAEHRQILLNSIISRGDK